MKTHTNKFKEQIKSYGKQIDSIITYDLDGEIIELGTEELNSVTPTYQSNILKSCMKQLDLDSNVDIPLGTILNYQFGLKVDGEYEYLNYGNYIVYKSEKQEDTDSYKITCYDKMLFSMIDYENMNITYPITIRNYINTICNYLGLTFKNINDEFANYDKQIQNELYLDTDGNSLGYTFRDVFDELAQVTASTICINEDDDELEIRYINDTGDTINEEYFKDINVNFGEKYGKVNSIVLSRASESDNVYLRDEESVALNGLCEIKIKNNQIMNFNDRSTYLPDILEVLDGLEYYLNDFSSTGILYYNLCDRYTVSIKGNTYSCIMFNDEINITQGLQENIHTDLLEQSETDYTKADKTDRLINSVYLIVDKQNAEIRAIAERVADVSETITGNGSVTLENAHEGILHYLEIEGNLHLLYPADDLYPANDLYPRDFNLIVDDEVYHLDINYLNYTSERIKDTYIYEDGTQKIIRRVAGIGGNPLTLPAEEREDIEIRVKEDSIIYLESFSNAKFKCTYLLENQYTNYFATQVDTKAEINVVSNRIEQAVSQVTDENGEITSASIILAINRDESLAEIQADKINLNGVVTANENFKILEDGSMETKDASITGGNLTLYDPLASDERASLILQKSGADYYTYLKSMEFFMQSPNKLIAFYVLDGTQLAQMIMKSGLNNNYPQGEIQNNVTNYSSSISIKQYTSSEENSTININTIQGMSIITLSVTNSSSTSISNQGITTPVVTQTSLEKDKKDFEKFNKGLETLKKIDIYKYHLKNEKESDKKHTGFVIGKDYNYSEEVTSKENDGVDIYSFVSVCCQAIKEQQAQIEELKNEISNLKGGK